MGTRKVPLRATVSDPVLQQVIDQLLELPKFLQEKACEREARRQFVDSVFGKIPKDILDPRGRDK